MVKLLSVCMDHLIIDAVSYQWNALTDKFIGMCLFCQAKIAGITLWLSGIFPLGDRPVTLPANAPRTGKSIDVFRQTP